MLAPTLRHIVETHDHIPSLYRRVNFYTVCYHKLEVLKLEEPLLSVGSKKNQY